MLKRSLLFPFFVSAAIGCGGASSDVTDASDGADTDESTLTGESYFAVQRAGSGFYASKIGKSQTKCADGVSRARCRFTKIEAPALPSADSARIAAAATSDATLGLVVRGVLRGASRTSLVVSQAWIAPSGACPFRGAVYLVTKNTCRTGRCAERKAIDLGTSSSRAIYGVDFGASPGTDAELTSADAASRTTVGLIAAGALTRSANGSLLEANEYLLPLVAADQGGLCGADLTAYLGQLSTGLLWMSETDRPFDVYAKPGEGHAPITPARLLALEGLPADAVVETRTVRDFFAHRTGPCDPAIYGEEFCAEAPRYRALVKAIDDNLTNATVIRVGTIDIRVYIVGQTACGDLAGLVTSVVET
jgi:hypothetical protein